jgi:hypothetical protein
VALFYLADAGLQAMGGALTASSLLTTVTSGAANTPGVWVPMHLAVPFPVSGLLLTLGKANIATAAVNTQFMFDIGVGPSGSENPVVVNVAAGGALSFATWEIPLAIASGSRISVRTRSLVASKATTMGMWVYGGGLGLESGSLATTYGAIPTSSVGTVLTAPGAINTEGAWTVISAATAAPMRFVLVGFASPNTATSTAADHLVDIGVGAAGLEAAIISDIPYSCSTNEECNCPRPLLFPVSIPAGSRLVARYRGTSIVTAASPNLTLTGIS